MAIKPINGHVLIEPVKHESFMASQKETYQELGVVIDWDDELTASWLEKGKEVAFDAWLGKRYPKKGSDTEFYWMIRYTDIVGYERQISE